MMESGDFKLDKTRVKDVYMSLRHANREVLEANNIKEKIDDFIFLTINMKHAITPQIATAKPPKPTPV
jgi:hypothetical protein